VETSDTGVLTCAAKITPQFGASGTVNLTFRLIDSDGGHMDSTFGFTVNDGSIILVWRYNDGSTTLIPSYDFGNVAKGSTAANRSYTVRAANIGDDSTPTIPIVTITATGGKQALWSVTNTCTVILNSQATCTATVTFIPGNGNNNMGVSSAVLSIESGSFKGSVTFKATKTN